MATPTASGSRPTPGQPHPPFTPTTASSPPGHPSNKGGVRSPVSRMKRSRADTLKGMEHSHSQQGAAAGGTGAGSTPQSSGLVGSSPAFLGTPGQSHHNTAAAGLGISLSTPVGATPGASAMQRGVSTSFGLSNLGLDASSFLNQDREAYARAKIAEIRDILSVRWGQLSRVGLQRVAARLKLECLWETGEGEETGVLDIAGGVFLLQVTFRGETVTDVQLSFSSAENSGRHKDPDEDKRGGAVLLNDLRGWRNETHNGFYVDLKPFALNAQHLAVIDHLSKGGIKCFEAIDGVLRSLQKVEEWWKGWHKEQHAWDRLSVGPGLSRMHGNGRVGARIEYWLDARMLKRGEGMWAEDHLEPATRRSGALFGLRISVAPLNAGAPTFIQPMRNSTDWFEFSDDIPMAEDDGNKGASDAALMFPPIQLELKEPPVYYHPASEGQTDDSTDPNQRPVVPVIFKAVFDPPLPMSYEAAASLTSNGHVNEVVQSYSSLLFPDSPRQHQSAPDSSSANDRDAAASTTTAPPALRQAISLRRPNCYHKPSKTLQTLRFQLTNTQRLMAVQVREIPFSHPMELLSILPTLRQWAWLRCFIKNTLGRPVVADGTNEASTSTANSNTNSSQNPQQTTRQASSKKRSKRDMTAKEVRAIIKAGGTWHPPSDTDSNSSDSDRERDTTENPPSSSSPHATQSTAPPGPIDITIELAQPHLDPPPPQPSSSSSNKPLSGVGDPSGSSDLGATTDAANADNVEDENIDLTGGIYLSLSIPMRKDVDPLMLRLCLLPGPRLVAAGASARDPFARTVARKLLLTEDVGLVAMWAREVRLKELHEREQKRRGAGAGASEGEGEGEGKGEKADEVMGGT